MAAASDSRPTVSKHFLSQIQPYIRRVPFWLPALPASAAFKEAFIAANANLADVASENTVYHERFKTAWKQSFLDYCSAHSSHVSRCAACVSARRERPVYLYSADSSPDGFESERPDFLTFRDVVVEMSGLGCDGVVELKVKTTRGVGNFKPADISQAVRYGRLVLSSQPLRDQVTICLCTLARVQFVRVFRHLPDIQLSPPSAVVIIRGDVLEVDEGMWQLYSYLLASHDAHGQRCITIEGWWFSEDPPRILGAGSFSDVLEMEGDHGRAALKLYQRTPLGRASFDLKPITDELAMLDLLKSTPASDHVPQVLADNLAVQYILLTPVGERLTDLHVGCDLIVGLVAAVQALHTYCIHRDLRAANILVVPGVPHRVKIIDWNLGLRIADLAEPRKPEGAVCVQGFAVLRAMAKNLNYLYTCREDLQSLVRAIFLVMCPGVTAPQLGASQFDAWDTFWERRLQSRAPPVGVESAWHVWMAAEERACAGDYDGLRDALLRVV